MGTACILLGMFKKPNPDSRPVLKRKRALLTQLWRVEESPRYYTTPQAVRHAYIREMKEYLRAWEGRPLAEIEAKYVESKLSRSEEWEAYENSIAPAFRRIPPG